MIPASSYVGDTEDHHIRLPHDVLLVFAVLATSATNAASLSDVKHIVIILKERRPYPQKSIERAGGVPSHREFLAV